MNNTTKFKKKIATKNLILTFIITILLIVIIRTTYAYLTINAKNTNDSTGTAGCFEVTYVGQAIENSNLKSTTSYSTTEAQTTVKLSKAENCEIYEKATIKINTASNITAPINNPQALKYKVIKSSGDGTILSGGEGTITTTGDTTLATVSLTETQTTYTIYIWIDSNLSLGYYDAKSYSGYIYADAISTSTITQ